MSRPQGPQTTPKTLARHATELSVLVSDTHHEDHDDEEHEEPPKRKHHKKSRDKPHKSSSESSHRGRQRPPSLDVPHEAIDVAPSVVKERLKSAKSAGKAPTSDVARKRMKQLMSDAASSESSDYISPKARQLVDEEREFEPNGPIASPDDLRLYNTSLILERYSDIFSDFDPRPYTERTISDDFIDEVKKRCLHTNKSTIVDQNDRNVLHLMMPEHKRDLDVEDQICSRIRDLFEKFYIHHKKRLRAARVRGLIWVIIGSIILGVSVPVDHYKDEFSCKDELSNTPGAWLLSVASVLLSPAGWYFFWEGLGFFFFRTQEPASELAVSKRMKNLSLMFEGYQKQYPVSQQEALRSVVENAEDYLKTTFSSPKIVRRPSRVYSERHSLENSRGAQATASDPTQEQPVSQPHESFLDL